MTDNKTTSEESAIKISAGDSAKTLAEREHFAAQSFYDVDPRLLLLLTSIFGADGEHTDSTIELTVVLDGTVISGSVVSEHAWVRRQNDQIGVTSPAIAEALDAVQLGIDERRQTPAEEAAANPRPTKQDRFIHFLEPTLLSGGNRIHMQATRANLRNVSAWSIGRLPED